MKSLIRLIFIIFVAFQSGCVSMENSKIIQHYFEPTISKVFIFRQGSEYALKVILSTYSERANEISKAKIIVNGKEISFRINKNGLVTTPFQLSSEQNITGNIEIETTHGTNNPLVFKNNLKIADSADLEVEPIIQPDEYRYRTALVIGNAAYKNPKNILTPPKNDADDIADALKSLGFNVTKKHDLSAEEMNKTLEEFTSNLKNSSEVRLFYYSGHGFNFNSENYMIPVDDNGKQSLALNEVLQKMGSHDNTLNITILDSCRDNDYSTEVTHDKETKSFFAKRNKDIQKNQLLIDELFLNTITSGTIKAFATSPAKSSFGISGERNSIYTSYLLKYIKTPNMSVETILKLASKQVQEKAQKGMEQQVPWVESSYIGNFTFIRKE